jgi:HK97 family phage prohead protease
VRDFVDHRQFSLLARAGRARDMAMRGTCYVARAGNGQNQPVRWVLSDGSVDRAGDRISPTGWDNTGFLKNPVVLYGHDAADPPIGRVVSLWNNGTQLVGEIEFAPSGVNELADTVAGLVRAGFIKAGSVGFVPIEWEFSSDPARKGGIDFKRQELLEFSIVAVPCNSNALIAARAKGIDLRPLARSERRGAVSADQAAARIRARALAESLDRPAVNPSTLRELDEGEILRQELLLARARRAAAARNGFWSGPLIEALDDGGRTQADARRHAAIVKIKHQLDCLRDEHGRVTDPAFAARLREQLDRMGG